MNNWVEITFKIEHYIEYALIVCGGCLDHDFEKLENLQLAVAGPIFASNRKLADLQKKATMPKSHDGTVRSWIFECFWTEQSGTVIEILVIIAIMSSLLFHDVD